LVKHREMRSNSNRIRARPDKNSIKHTHTHTPNNNQDFFGLPCSGVHLRPEPRRWLALSLAQGSTTTDGLKPPSLVPAPCM
jgi:hypothetical protein